MEDDERQQENSAYQKKLQQMQLDGKKRELLKKMLTPSAYERMGNVRISSPELYEKVASSLAYVLQSGRPMERITDEQLVGLLAKMTERPETKIEFRKK